MDCLLLGGANSVGKSEAIFRLAHRILARGFRVVGGSIPQTFADFRAVLEGANLQGNSARLIINSASDTVQIINDFRDFFNDNGIYDILISSIRDGDFWPREDFFRIMDIQRSENLILEIPLAKITRKMDNFDVALIWYEQQLDNLINHILARTPFDI